jgi:hypothetical protein
MSWGRGNTELVIRSSTARVSAFQSLVLSANSACGNPLIGLD